MAKTMAYIRVSTDRQDVENQRIEILKLANDKDLGAVEFVEETISGRKPWRDRQLAAIIEELSKDDCLIVAELSRLGRSMLTDRCNPRSSPWLWPWRRRSSGI